MRGILVLSSLSGLAMIGATQGILAAEDARTEITISEANAAPENLTSSKDGTVFFGSTTTGTIYRAPSSAIKADPWVNASTDGLPNVLGVLADDKSNTLWVCANPPFGAGNSPKPPMALKAFDLKTGKPKGVFPIAGEGAINDVAVAADGTVYVSDTFGARVLRLKPGAKDVDVWLADAQLRGIDGLSFLADGALYVNNFFNGKLSRISLKPNGEADKIVDIQTSMPFRRPDGMRTSGPKTLIQVEAGGRLTEITVNGDRGDVRVIKEGLTSAAGVTQLGSVAFVLVERSKGVAVSLGPAK